MKKVFLSFVMLLTTFAASAQGTWEKTVTEADELKGIDGGEAYIYTVPQMGSFVFWGWDKYQFRLISEEAPFNTQVTSGRTASYTGQEILVGIYDNNDKMIDKFVMWLDLEDNTSHRFIRTRNAGGMLNPAGQKGKVKKIFKAFQSGNGYVRIVTERYNTTDFDIKITPYSQE